MEVKDDTTLIFICHTQMMSNSNDVQKVLQLLYLDSDGPVFAGVMGKYSQYLWHQLRQIYLKFCSQSNSNRLY